MGILTLDTCFLIDHQREILAKKAGPAHQFCLRHPDDFFAVSSIAWGEFTAGFPSLEQPELMEIRHRLQVLPIDEAASLSYARIFRELKQSGNLIGSNDLWIAALALSQKLPLVSRNQSDFLRVPGLEVLTY